MTTLLFESVNGSGVKESILCINLQNQRETLPYSFPADSKTQTLGTPKFPFVY